jgi:hypothetical protein
MMIREIVLLPSDPNDDSAKSRPDPYWVLAEVVWEIAQKRIAARNLAASMVDEQGGQREEASA